MACATMRAFAKVKSSAITPRQPSVPKRMEVIEVKYTRRDPAGNRPDETKKQIPRYAREDQEPAHCWGATRRSRLQQIFALLFFEFFNNFADILGAFPGADQQGVRSVDDYEVTNADGRDVFRRAPQKVSLGVDDLTGTSENIFPRFFSQELVHSSPGTDIAPTYFGGNHENSWVALFARGRFEHRIVNGDIFQPGIYITQLLFIAMLADAGGQRFESGVRFRQMLFQIFEECRNAPEKHAGVPMIVTRAGIFFGERQRRFLREAPHRENREAFRVQ